MRRSPLSMRVPLDTELLIFIGGVKYELMTVTQSKPFTVRIEGDTIVCHGNGKVLRKIPPRRLSQYLGVANRLPRSERFISGAYPQSWQMNSYFVAILKEFAVRENQFQGVFPEEVPNGAEYVERAVSKVLVNRYERCPKARRQCLARHGTICVVCRVSLESTYGPIASGLIHVHHLKARALTKEDYRLNPERDLVPVCPNCHAVIHWQKSLKNLRSVEEVQALIRNSYSTKT